MGVLWQGGVAAIMGRGPSVGRSVRESGPGSAGSAQDAMKSEAKDPSLSQPDPDAPPAPSSPPSKPAPVGGIGVVAIDLDGTLLNDSKQVSRRTVRALDGLPDRGVKVVIA